MELIIIISLVAIGYWIGNMHASYKFFKIMKKVAQEQGVDLDKEVEKLHQKVGNTNEVYKLATEKHGDMLYLLNRESDDFVCQGKSLDELASLAQKYKNIKLATVVHDDKVFMFIDGNSKEYTG